MPYTVAKFDSTGYSLTVIATGMESHQVLPYLVEQADTWALYTDFVLFVEHEDEYHFTPKQWRFTSADGEARYIGPATQTPAVNAIWNRLRNERRRRIAIEELVTLSDEED